MFCQNCMRYCRYRFHLSSPSTVQSWKNILGRFNITNTSSADVALILIAWLRVIYHKKENFSEIRMSNERFVENTTASCYGNIK